MEFWETVRTSIVASIFCSWIASPFVGVSALVITFAQPPGIGRRCYLAANLAGGIAGEFCAVFSLFFSEMLFCQAHPSCNTAQGGIVLIFFIPLETCVGSLLALGCTWLTLKMVRERRSGSSRTIWSCSILLQLTMFVAATWILANLMA